MNKCLICKQKTINQKYCNMICYGISKKGIISINKGKLMSEEQKKKISKTLKGRAFSQNLGKFAQKGNIPWNKGIGKGPYQKTGKYRDISGENNMNWKGGITPIYKKIRESFEYEEWRKVVFERDNYTCQHCKQVGGYLEADHIKPFAYFPELRFEIKNGRTLCKPCHKRTDTYMGRARRQSLRLPAL